jgi:hypothetical protein
MKKRKGKLDVEMLRRISKVRRTRMQYVGAVLRKAKPHAVPFNLLTELMAEKYAVLGGTPNRLRLIGILQQFKEDGKIEKLKHADMYQWTGRVR